MPASGSLGAQAGRSVGPARVQIAGGVGARSSLIERLRERIRTIEQAPVSLTCPPALPGTGCPRSACTLAHGSGAPAGPAWTFGVPEIDGALPWAGLEPAGLHEVRPAGYRDGWAALGFALALLGRHRAGGDADGRRAVLWGFTDVAARECGLPYGPGLAAFGLDPGALLLVRAERAQDLAWALEEGLKSRALLAVLGQIDVAQGVPARRLALAAATHGTPCLVVPGPGTPVSGPALTRWRVAAAPGRPDALDATAPGAAR
ncbi:MAG: hypothetical protein MI824_20435, partial [Hyphomicrobiales bacterium]|nr:hypothetical protein [Hyphomicrobiales bacterium]